MIERTYPEGVPCWVDVEAADPAAACDFYSGLFGWRFEEAVPAGAPGSYLVARLDGRDVAAVAPGDGQPAAWNTYVAVDDADASAARVTELGGTVSGGPQDAGPGGRLALCADPRGAAFRLWQPRRRLGAQLVNAPGTWNFSDLRTPDPAAALAFYGALFGWEADQGEPGGAALWRRPGYGDHLAATVDPDIRVRQATAPPGFADAVAWLQQGTGPARWRVTFAVADRDAGLATAERLGGSVVGEPVDGPWSRTAVVRDPQGAELTLSQFTPPADR